MKKLLLTTAVVFSFAILFAQSKKYTPQEIEQGENLEQKKISEDEYGLIVTMGGVNGSAGQGGYGLFGNPNGGHVNIDNNEIQAKSSPTNWSRIYLNYWGGDTDIGYGSTGPSDINLGRAANDGLLNAYGILYVNGDLNNVGINTSTPNTSLHIDQDGAGGIYIEGDGAGDARLRISNAGGSHYLFDDASNNNALKLQAADEFAILTGGTNERLRIDELGRVAINRTIGNVQLYVESDQENFGIVGTNTRGTGTTYGVWGTATGGTTGTRYGVYGSASGGANNWAGYFTGNTYVGGNLGVGETTPESLLHVNTATDGCNFGIRTGGTQGYVNTQRPAASTNLNIHRWRDNTSSVAVVTDVAAIYQFQVFGDAQASGGMWVNSDAKLKTNIQTLEAGTLTKVMNLSPKTYNWTKDEQYSFLNLKDKLQIGFLAQDLEAVFPEVVQNYTEVNADGDSPVYHELKSVNYSALVPVLTKAIQEQQAEIEKLRTELAAFKQLEERMSKIEATIIK